MRKILLLIAFFSNIGLLCAQRYERSSNLSVNMLFPDKIGVSVEYEKLLLNGNSFHCKTMPLYVEKKNKSSDFKGEYLDLFAGAGYRKYFKKPTSNIIPFLGVTGCIGYEFIQNEDDISSSTKVTRKNSFIYGLSGDAGVEFNFNKISFLLSAVPLYEFNNRELYVNAQVGIKLFIF